MKGMTRRDALLNLSMLERAIGAGQLERDNERFLMSDDKKRDRVLQRRVRERQAKTGESYQAAWRQLTGSTAPAEDALTEDAPPQEVNDAKSVAPMPFAPRLILPLHLPRVLPHQPMRATARAKEGAIDIDRIFISGAGTEGGASDWVVNDIEVDGRSQLTLKNLSGALFGTRGVAANPKATTTFSIEGFDPVEYDRELAIIVTYVGSNPDGIPLYASAVGSSPPQRPTIVPIVSDAPLPISTKTTIGARIENAPFQVDRIEIEEAWDWIVNDLRINGKTQFAQSGNIPGDMFATTAIVEFVSLEECGAGDEIEIDVTYIGAAEKTIFKGRLEGTVVRDDYSSPPPDLRVIIRTGDKITDTPVIATCNWRPPMIRGGTS